MFKPSAKKNKENFGNFLPKHDHRPYFQNRGTMFYFSWTAAILILIVIVPALVFGSLLAYNLRQAEVSVRLVASQVKNGQWSQAADNLDVAGKNIASANRNMLNMGPIIYLPPVGRVARNLQAIFSASEDLLSGYGKITRIFGEISGQLGPGASLFGGNGESKAALQAISDRKAKFTEAGKDISAAETEMAKINFLDFPASLRDRALSFHGLLKQVADGADLALPIVGNLPEILGLNGEKTYLLIFQNNMEIRPTGGFIGSYGLLKIKDGEINDLAIDDVYNLDKLTEGKLMIPAPEPMVKYINQKYWFMRDANWSPDWPTSAKQINQFFDLERAAAGLSYQKIDGVIALSPDFTASLLEVVGPIAIGNLSFGHENFAQDLEKFVEFDYVQKGIDRNNRKAIIGDLAKIIIDNLKKLDSSKVLNIFNTLKKSIDGKQILVYLTDGNIQKDFNNQNWSGMVRPAEGDYLWVIDSNLGAMKTDQVMKKSISYQVAQNVSGDLIGTAKLTYEHQGQADPGVITDYRDYVRVYLPVGTWVNRAYLEQNGQIKELDLSQDVTFGSEFGRVYVATFFTVDIGTTRQLVLEYKLPEKIKNQYINGDYQLLVQKQPGTTGHDLSVSLNFGKKISGWRAEEQPSLLAGSAINWQEKLTHDFGYEVKFSRN